jgi:calcium channel MID1
MTTRGVGGLPKQQFLLSGLNASTEYNVYLALPGNTISNSGTIFGPSVSLKTKTDDTCQLVYDLPFCTEVAYAVPGNPAILDPTSLATFYDSNASALFSNFSLTLQLYPCNRTHSALYSLLSTCSGCLATYKTWLCAVTIPRCTDISDTAPFLYPRTNSSRNPSINQIVNPGPYNEILPCSDLCFLVEQNCPAAVLGFQCPLPGSFALFNGYGTDDTGVMCNALHMLYMASGANRIQIQGLAMVAFLVHLAFWIDWG